MLTEKMKERGYQSINFKIEIVEKLKELQAEYPEYRVNILHKEVIEAGIKAFRENHKKTEV
jgi:hypothetical protein